MSDEKEKVELEEEGLLASLSSHNMDEFREVFLEQHPYDQAKFF